MKYLVVIGDGMADNPVEALGGKTPLEYADIPTIDSLAARGTVGSVVNCPKPLPAGSETAILSIFGCDPLKHFSGRSPMEAAAIGLRLVPGDAAFRCNLVTLEDDKHLQVNYFCSTVVRLDALERFPGLEDVLMQMDGILTDQEMAALNYQVEVEGLDEQDVARDFLIQKGLLEA